MDKIPHNQEIPGVAHLFDDFQFDVEPLQIGGAYAVMLGGGRVAENDGEPLFKAVAGDLFHVGVERVAVRHVVFRQDVAAEFEGELALFRDFQRIRQRVGMLGKDCGHFRRRFDVKLARIVSHALRVVHEFARADAEQDVMRRGVGLIQIMAIVRRHDRQAEILREFD